MKGERRFILVPVIGLALVLSSCATPMPTKSVAYAPPEIPMRLPPPVLRQDVLHIVDPGETLWRIGKMYDVEMKDIMRANRLKNAGDLKMGQQLLIPNAAKIRKVEIPLYRSNKWKYIIIHHSATDEGSALSFFKSHLKRGFWQGLGYHFVIANGTCGKEDGQIEISPRWLKQQDGAHCAASGMNYRGIGICLVGNFSKERISPRQLDSLIYLVSALKKQYKIPVRNVMGHSQVPGARTECPGTYFPWDDFLDSLRSSE